MLTLGGVDWDLLISIARANGVAPLLYRALQTICPDHVPADVLSLLRTFFHVNALHSRLLAEELLRLLRLFETHDISAIPYRGGLLAADAYGELALRLYCDLDLIVREGDLRRAGELLCASGYHQERHPDRAYKFAKTEGRIVVELHRTFVEKHWTFRLDPNHLWENLRPVSILDTSVLTFSPGDLLLLICMHGARDYWMRLGKICDVAELILAHPEIDLSRMLTRSRRMGSERVFLLGLNLAHTLLGTPLPVNVRSRLEADAMVGALTEQIRERLFATERRLSYAEKRFLPIHMKERFSDRIRYLFYWIRTDLRGLTPWGFREGLAMQPASPGSLSYPHFLARLLTHYGRSPMQSKKLRSLKEMLKHLV
jgi:hypothetical protein